MRSMIWLSVLALLVFNVDASIMTPLIAALRPIIPQNTLSNKKPNSIDIIVSTSLGSQFLNKRKKCTVASNATIASVKEKLAIVYPGTPPAELQRLYFGLKYLSDATPIANITNMRPIPLLMDNLSGTGSYQRNMSIAETLEAYAALLTQQIYVNEKLASFIAPSENNTRLLETPRYRQIFNCLNNTIFNGYEERIALALEKERNPELISDEILAWRGSSKQLSPLQSWLAHQFFYSRNTMKSLLTYTSLLVHLSPSTV